jgi:hypothetical protein
LSATGCGLNGSAQHLLEVYSQESENLKSFAGVDLNTVLLCPGPIKQSGQIGSFRQVLSQHSLDVTGAEVLRQFRCDFAPGVTKSPVALATEEEEIG